MPNVPRSFRERMRPALGASSCTVVLVLQYTQAVLYALRRHPWRRDMVAQVFASRRSCRIKVRLLDKSKRTAVDCDSPAFVDVTGSENLCNGLKRTENLFGLKSETRVNGDFTRTVVPVFTSIIHDGGVGLLCYRSLRASERKKVANVSRGAEKQEINYHEYL
jgi:hypothetical protein